MATAKVFNKTVHLMMKGEQTKMGGLDTILGVARGLILH